MFCAKQEACFFVVIHHSSMRYYTVFLLMLPCVTRYVRGHTKIWCYSVYGRSVIPKYFQAAGRVKTNFINKDIQKQETFYKDAAQ